MGALINKLLSLTPNNHWQQKNGNDVHLVITGGEPLLGWQRAYEELLSDEDMIDLKNLTFETNGTQRLLPKFKDYLKDWAQQGEITFSVSPKLSAIKPEVVREYETVGTTYLKFVVDSERHFEEVDQAVFEYRSEGFKGVVYVMPQGGVVTPYAQNRVNVADWALSRGYNYSPRLHVDLWGNGWGK
jgi:organic radical activating enzyme